MWRWLFASVLGLGLALAQQSDPDYSKARFLLSLDDLRTDKLLNGAFPLVEVIDVQKLREFQKDPQCQKSDGSASDASQSQNPPSCPKFEWSAPFALLSDSQEVAKGLRQSWQRFEERYWYRVESQLNNPASYLVYCTLGLNSSPQTPMPEVKIHVQEDFLPGGFDPKLDFSQADPMFYLDNYTLIPQVPKEDFCDGLDLQILPIMFIPGICISLEGVTLICTPNYPMPLWFNWDEAISRVVSAITTAHTKYLLEYQSDVATHLLPGKHGTFVSFPWHSHLPGDGAISTPVVDTSVDVGQYQWLAEQAGNNLEGADALNAYAYYFQHLPGLGLTRSPTLQALLFGNSVLGSPPGAWRLEEMKRWLKPANPLYYEHFGYASFFQVWSQLDTTVLPEGKSYIRPILYKAFALDIQCHILTLSCEPIPMPTVVSVPPFVSPFVGPRSYWGWISVPEGYPIPRVDGEPLLDLR
jgi:hypothetical protein